MTLFVVNIFWKAITKQTQKIKTLKPNAIPSVFPHYPSHKLKCKTPKRLPPTKPTIEPSSTGTSSKRLKRCDMVSNVKHDHCYAQQSVEKALAQERIKNRILEDKYEASQKCIKALREKLKRRDQENKDLLLQAREQRLLETDQCEILKANLSAEAQKLFLNERKKIVHYASRKKILR